MIRACCLLAVLVMVSGSHAIIIRHDVAPSLYEIRATDYPALFYLERQGNRRICAATVIHRQWALTAAHCVEQTPLGSTLRAGRSYPVQLAGAARDIDEMVVHPDFEASGASEVDLALLRFRAASSLPRPMPLQLAGDEAGATVSLLGWGYFGLGTTGRQYDDGRLRRAYNRVIQADRRLRIYFDDPRQTASAPLELEGMPSLGDSGGPALMESDGIRRLAGIAVGEVQGEDFSEETQGRYGSVAVYERVSSHINWIEAVIGEQAPFGAE